MLQFWRGLRESYRGSFPGSKVDIYSRKKSGNRETDFSHLDFSPTTGPRHTLTSRVSRYGNQVGYLDSVTVGQAAWHKCWGSPAIVPTFLGPRGQFAPALVYFNGAWFIARCLRYLLLRKCRRSPMHFWSRRGCLGYGLAPSPHVKKALCDTLALRDDKQIPRHTILTGAPRGGGFEHFARFACSQGFVPPVSICFVALSSWLGSLRTPIWGMPNGPFFGLTMHESH